MDTKKSTNNTINVIKSTLKAKSTVRAKSTVKTLKNNLTIDQPNTINNEDIINEPTTPKKGRGRGRPKKIVINPSSPKQILLNDQLIKAVDQCELFKIISNYKESEDYYITITKSHKVEISLLSKSDGIHSLELVDINNDIELKKISNYTNTTKANTTKVNNKILRKILSSLVNYSKNIKAIIKYKEDYEIEKSVLYVWLLPTDIENEYIVKIGYSKDLIKRKSELCKMFGVVDLLLLFCIEIKNEGYESYIHNHIKKNYPHLYIETEKAFVKKTIIDKSDENDDNTEKTEKSKFCVETYKFDIILIITIMDILRKEILSTENYGKELDIHNNEIKLEIEKEQVRHKEIELKIEQEQTKRKQEEEQTKRMQIEYDFKNNELAFKEKELIIRERELIKKEKELNT